MAKEKPHINVVFVGHVDHGKSTTVGRLLYDTGHVEEQALRKLKEKAQELGKVGFEFAFVMDNLKEERERGVTIDLSHEKFTSQKYEMTIIDAPGHKDFIKNMITGASKTDDINFIAASAFKGDNIAKKSENMSWYKGPTLLEQLDLFKEPEKPVNLPLRLPLQDVYNITGIGVVPVGRVETGVM